MQLVKSSLLSEQQSARSVITQHRRQRYFRVEADLSRFEQAILQETKRMQLNEFTRRRLTSDGDAPAAKLPLPNVLTCLAIVMMFNSPLHGQHHGGSPAMFTEVAAHYNIEIVWTAPKFPQKTHWGLIDGVSAGQPDLIRYETIFCQEFCLYPKLLVEKTNVRRIVLCQELKFAGGRRYAIPDFEHDTYYLDVGTIEQPNSYLRKVIHHDFFHIIDYRDDGLLYEDERWKALNAPDFKYGKGGASALGDLTTGDLTDKLPGFLTHYSTTGVEEDKAEIFAHLVVSSKFVAERTATDSILADKVDQIRSIARSFCSDMTDDFWSKAQSLPRDAD